MGWISLVFSAALLSCAVPPALSDEHSLFYTYTALSKPLNLPGIYEFTALGTLNDRELDYYSSKTQVKEPKQDWMKEKLPADYWEKGTQSRRSKEQWFKVNVDILIDRMKHNKSDLHVLQWRHGCVVKNDTDGNITFLRGVDEYSYDGDEFLSFDDINSRWIAPVPAAEPTKRKWDDVAILNQYTKGYLEKECVDWLKKFMEYGQEEIRKQIPPEVHIFSKQSVRDPKLETLTCLATGFIPPDAKIYLKKSRTRLPDHLVTSTGIVPNGDGTYQLRSHTDVVRDTTVVYECCVTHSALNQPIVRPWVFKDDSGITVIMIGAAVAVVVLLLVILIVFFVLKKKGIICHSTGSSEDKSLRGSSGSSSAESVKLNDNSGKASSDASSEDSKENPNEQNKPMLPDEHV